MVNVVDKRGENAKKDVADTTDRQATPTVEVVEYENPVDALINKTFNFMINQKEYFYVLNLPRPERKRLEKAIAKMLTRFPHFKKVGDAQNS